MSNFKLRLLKRDRVLKDRPDCETEDTTPNLRYFFKQWKRKFWKLISINLIMLVQLLPIFVVFYAYVLEPKWTVSTDPLRMPLFGAQAAMPTGEGATLIAAVNALVTTISARNSPFIYIAIGMAVLHIATFGWQKAGCTYIMRNLVRGDGVFIISDFFYAIKKNLKQGFWMGLIDSIAIFALAVDFLYFSGSEPTGFNNFMYVMIIALALIWYIMRFYLYLMMVTFDMPIRKMLKNALIFTALGIKRNLMALLGIALLTALFVALIVVCATYIGFNFIGIAVILPILCYLAFTCFMYTYAAWPVVERYMITPVAPQGKAEDEQTETENAEN